MAASNLPEGDPLNLPQIDPSYRPPPLRVYRAPEATHYSLVRIQNTLVIPGVAPAWETYWFGLVLVPCILLLVYVVWTFTICVTGCCATTGKGKRYRGYLCFMFCLVLSLFFWIPVMVYNAQTETGVDNIVSAGNLLVDWLADVGNLGISMNTTLTASISANDRFYSSCVQTVAPVIPELADKYEYEAINDALVTSQENLNDVILKNGVAAENSVLDFINLVENYRYVRLAVVLALAILISLLTILFGTATSINYLEGEGDATIECKGCERNTCGFGTDCGSSKMKSMCSRTSCITIFTVGMLFLTVSFLFIGIMQLLSTVVSDVCVPDPDQLLQRLLAQSSDALIVDVTSNCQQSEDLTYAFLNGYPAGTKLTDLGNAENEALILCYYQTCTGDNVVARVLQIINENEASIIAFFNEYSLDLKESLNQTDISGIKPELEQCIASVVILQDIVRQLSNNLINLSRLFSCSRINPVYVLFLHDGICNEAVVATILMWTFFVVTLILLMLAMLIHRIFRLEKPRDYDFMKIENTKSKPKAGLYDTEVEAEAHASKSSLKSNGIPEVAHSGQVVLS